MPQRQRTQRPPIDLAVELERAVERNEFGLEYQPIIDLGSGAIAAVEALLRWRHPLMGTIAPAEYLPLAEETGHIVPIGERVLDAATRQLRTWHLGFARMQGLKVNVNISPRQLSDDNLIPHITTVLQRSDLDPSSLTLELGTGCNAHPDRIAELAAIGVGLALEDFGQGSSLDDVREMPLTSVKLVPTFATMAAGNDDDVAFAESRARTLPGTWPRHGGQGRGDARTGSPPGGPRLRHGSGLPLLQAARLGGHRHTAGARTRHGPVHRPLIAAARSRPRSPRSGFRTDFLICRCWPPSPCPPHHRCARAQSGVPAELW